ncbi:hypothetical protein [Candidatus Thiodiazotropha sp. CDECU1]|uniref:hypothetical protein n=1 Tax=Candidatus Thiodiazotropha sp. CDECU1 TaxID=3065865 RepID=UPI00292DDE4C|nr:hypothetical protein [Candidatus Thiodiazotropha sp. CDECU1]
MEETGPVKNSGLGETLTYPEIETAPRRKTIFDRPKGLKMKETGNQVSCFPASHIWDGISQRLRK